MKKLTALLLTAALCQGNVYAAGESEKTAVSAITEAAGPETLQADTAVETAEEEISAAEETVQSVSEQPAEQQAEPAAETENLTETGTEEIPDADTGTEADGAADAKTEGDSGADTAEEKDASDASADKTAAEETAEPGTDSVDSAVESTADASESEKNVEEAGETAEAEQAAKEFNLTVRNEQGELLTLEKITGPQQLTSGGATYPVEYVQGVYRLKLPTDAQTLQILVPDEISEAVSLTKWSGYLAEQEKTWYLCPDDPMEGAYTAEGNTYTANLEKFRFSLDGITLEQLAVYGDLTNENSYAEIFIYNKEISSVLLIEFTEEVNTAQTDTEASAEETLQPETETEAVGEEEITDASMNDENAVPVNESNNPEEQTETAKEQTEITEVQTESEDAQTLAATEKQISSAYVSTGQNLADSAAEYTPGVSSINGEWQILGLARSGQKVDSDLYSKYLANVVSTLEESNGVLHAKKYTEYSRVVLALTALGEDVTDVAGYNLLEPLADFDQTVWQGVNGAIFALIAFDSHNYEIPAAVSGKTQTTRENLIEYILSVEISGGGWDLSGRTADPDVTAMAIQALAPYYSTNSAVKSAVDRGVAKLSALQQSNGAYGSYGTVNSESCSQVIVALTALGINPNTDSRFVKNGKSVVDALLSFTQSDGSFSHVASGSSDQMATEQAYYAMTAYQRFIGGNNRLYDMTDVAIKSDYEKAASVEKLLAALPTTVKLSHKDQIEAAAALYNSLNHTQKSLIPSEYVTKLENAQKKLEALVAADNSSGNSGNNSNQGNSSTGSSSGNSTGGSSSNGSSTGTKTASGTTKQVNLVSSSNRTGGTSAGGSSSGSSSYASGSSSSGSAASDQEDGTEEEADELTAEKQGSTKSDKTVTSLISDINALFRTSKSAEKLPEGAADYSDAQIEAIVDIYRTYSGLEREAKKTVEESIRYSDYLEVLEKLKTMNHYDESSGTDLRDNGEDVLPWYVQLYVSQQIVEADSADTVREALKENGELLTLNDVNLIDLLNGGEWQPEDLVRVIIPMTDLGEYESVAIAHLKEDGTLEFIEAHISGSNLEFDTDAFSKFGIVGFNGSMDELMAEQEDQMVWIYFLPAGGAAVLLLLIIVIRAAGSGKKKGVKNSEG